MRFPGKVAIVTGGGSGIGEATCQLFAEEGAKVVVVDVVGERVHRVVGGIRERGGQALGVVADLRRPSDIERIGVATLDAYRGIDILVNNAGVVSFGGLLEVPEEEWEQMLDINLRAVYRCSRMAVPVMMKQGRGKIVNVASTSAFLASPRVLAYATTKGAVVSLTRAMAIDLIRHNIFVNGVVPGSVRTNISRPAESRAPHESAPNVPIGHWCEPEEQARCILFLASSDSDYMVGQCIHVDGGQSVVSYPRSSPCFSEKGM